MSKILSAQETKSFEGLRQNNEHAAEYWSARDLQSMLGYGQWRRFEDAIKRAMTSCETSGNNADYHFAGAGKMIELAASQFRMTQTRDKLAREGIQTHEQVGKEVRDAIKCIGEALPEKILSRCFA